LIIVRNPEHEMKARSRRDFLKSASASAAALALLRNTQVAHAFQGHGEVKVWASFRDKRHAPLAPIAWKKPTEAAADAIQLDTATPRQEILGFGAAITEASAYVLSRLSDAERAPVMHDLFASDALNLNVCRTCIGASDYATKLYSYDESPEPDPELKSSLSITTSSTTSPCSAKRGKRIPNSSSSHLRGARPAG